METEREPHLPDGPGARSGPLIDAFAALTLIGAVLCGIPWLAALVPWVLMPDARGLHLVLLTAPFPVALWAASRLALVAKRELELLRIIVAVDERELHGPDAWRGWKRLRASVQAAYAGAGFALVALVALWVLRTPAPGLRSLAEAGRLPGSWLLLLVLAVTCLCARRVPQLGRLGESWGVPPIEPPARGEILLGRLAIALFVLAAVPSAGVALWGWGDALETSVGVELLVRVSGAGLGLLEALGLLAAAATLARGDRVLERLIQRQRDSLAEGPGDLVPGLRTRARVAASALLLGSCWWLPPALWEIGASAGKLAGGAFVAVGIVAVLCALAFAAPAGALYFEAELLAEVARRVERAPLDEDGAGATAPS